MGNHFEVLRVGQRQSQICFRAAAQEVFNNYGRGQRRQEKNECKRGKRGKVVISPDAGDRCIHCWSKCSPPQEKTQAVREPDGHQPQSPVSGRATTAPSGAGSFQQRPRHCWHPSSTAPNKVPQLRLFAF